MGTMSTRCQAARGWGWLLLLGGLTACGYDVPWLAADAAGPAGRGLEEPGTGEEPEPYAPDTEVEATGVLAERFVNKGYGAAWTLQTADLDNDGTEELLYGGRSVVAIGADDKPLWTFDLPAKGKEQPGKEGYEGREPREPRSGMEGEQTGEEYGQAYGEEYREREEREGGEYEPGEEYEQGKEGKGNELAWLGVHVREIRVTGGDLLVLDSLNRVHRINGEDGSLVWTKNLEGKGNACDLAIFDADGDDVADFFPSGGKIAYSGKTGEKLFEADIDFDPVIVKAGQLDGTGAREIVLVRGGEEETNLCPAEENVLLAMKASKGMMKEGEGGEIGKEDQQPQLPSDRGEGLPRAGRDEGYEGFEGSGDVDSEDVLPRPEEREDGRDQERERERGDANVYVLDLEGNELFTGGGELENIHSVLITPMDGRGMLILGGDDGIVALDPMGEELWTTDLQNIDQLLLSDLDGDGNRDVLAHVVDQGVSTLHAIGSQGNELWNAPLDGRVYAIDALDIDGDDRDEILTSIGAYGKEQAKSYARTVAWTLGDQGPEELWSVEEFLPARAFVSVRDEKLYVAGSDATLRILGPTDGKEQGVWNAGSVNHAVGAGDLDGDGVAEVISGDIFGNLTIAHENGQPTTMKFESEGPAVVTGIAVAEGEGGNGVIIASGYAWNSPDRGILQGFDAEGNTLFTITNPNGLGDVKVADLDGNGTKEIVVAQFAFRMGQDTLSEDEPMGGEEEGRGEGMEPTEEMSCGVLAYDLSGDELWQTQVSSCDLGRIAVGDVDGDGAYEVAYGDLGREGPFHVALVNGDGTLRFDTTVEDTDAVWLAVIDGGVAFGGRAGDKEGHVTLLDPMGEELWSIQAGGEAKDVPMMQEESPFGAFAGTFFGTEVADIDGDGMQDLAFTTVDGQLQVVSSMNGEPIFEADLGKEMKLGQRQNERDDGRDGSRGEERMGELMGGPLTYVESARGAGTLVVTGYDFRGMSSAVAAFDVNEGKVVGTMRLPGFVAGIAPAGFGENVKGFALATTYDTYGVDVKAKGAPLPEVPKLPEPEKPGIEPDLGEGVDDGMTED